MPDVVAPLSNDHVLTSTFFEGMSFFAFARDADSREKDRAGEAIWELFFATAFGDGVFHADAHPGNLLFSGTKVAFLDFGRVIRSPQRFGDSVRRLVRAVLERDRPAARAATCDLGFVANPERFDFEHDYRTFACFYLPWLRDEPFRFERRYLEECWRLFFSHNPNSRLGSIPADAVFLNQLAFGVGSLLSRLGASIHVRPRVLDLLYPAGAPRPAPYTQAELDALGIASSQPAQ